MQQNLNYKLEKSQYTLLKISMLIQQICLAAHPTDHFNLSVILTT